MSDVDVEVFSGINALGGVLCFIGGCLCAGAGIGGGAFYIPVFVLILGMDPHIAIPLSKATIFGVAVGGYIVNWRKRHPNADRPLICYDVANVMEPMTLFGTVIGVYLNVVFPAYLILVFLITLLSFTTYKTFKKGRAMYAKENAVEIEKNGNLQEDHDGKFLSSHDEDEEEIALLTGGEEEREKFLEEERKIPVLKVLFLFLVWCGSFVIVLMKGGTEPDSSLVGVDCGSVAYWLIVSSELPYLVIVTAGFCYYLYHRHQRKVACAFPFVEGDVMWDKTVLVTLPPMSIIAGIAAGFLGIGGGMVKGPLMLNMGMLSHVSSATSSYMILFTSSSTSFQYLILGVLPVDFAIYYFIIGLVAAVVGNLVVSYFVKKYKKQSYIAFLLCTCTVLSAILMTVMTIFNVVNGSESMKFSKICETDDYSDGTDGTDLFEL